MRFSIHSESLKISVASAIFAVSVTFSSTPVHGQNPYPTNNYEAYLVPESNYSNLGTYNPTGLTINNVMVGFFTNQSGTTATGAVRYPASTQPQNLPTYDQFNFPYNYSIPPGSTLASATGSINKNGLIVGTSYPISNSSGAGAGPSNACILDINTGATYVASNVDNSPTFFAGINTSGTIVGTYGPGTGGFIRQFNNGSIVTFAVPNSTGTYPLGINDAGMIVGSYAASTPDFDDPQFSQIATHSFLIPGGTGAYNIDPPAYTPSGTFTATGISNTGLVSMSSSRPATYRPQGVYYNTSYLLNLNTSSGYSYTIINLLLPNGSQSYSTTTTSINDNGYICGQAIFNTNYASVGYIASPPGLALPNEKKVNLLDKSNNLSIDGIPLGPNHPRYLGEVKFVDRGKINVSTVWCPTPKSKPAKVIIGVR